MLVPVAALLVLAAVPAVARATTVAHRSGGPRGPLIHVLDATGVDDRLQASGAGVSSVTVRSTNGTAISAGFQCTQISPTQVDCPGGIALLADLAGGDDVFLQGARIQSVLNGGEGNDRLTGGPEVDIMRGFAGNDFLLGGEGNDDEFGNEGNDTLGRRAGSRNFGTEDPGKDSFRGDEGFDLLFTADGSADAVIDCGSPALSGVASFLEGTAIDLADPRPKGCETVSTAAKDQHPTVQVRGGALRVRTGSVLLPLRCPRATVGGRCAGTATIKKGSSRVARGRYRIRAGRSRRVRLRLRRSVRGPAQVLTRERDTDGMPKTTRTRVVLRR
jgi:RTX calcium-binding nonapeptide repeat (4 copies)